MMKAKVTAEPSTHLGNVQLHRRHSVMIEGGKVPRAKVMDQHIFDRYLMLGLITLKQHRAAEFLLDQARVAGVWAKGIDLSRAQVQDGVRNNVPFRIFPMGRTLTRVRKRFGDFHPYLVKEVVCFDWDVRHDEKLMACLCEALDWIADRSINHVPINNLRRAIKKARPEPRNQGGE